MSVRVNFEQREQIGNKILQIIKGEGYTKSSFAKMVDISRPTLNQIIDGKTPSETTFMTQINKVIEGLGMTLEEIINYKNKESSNSKVIAYSDNSPKDHVLNDRAINTLDILDNVLDLYEIYYK